MYQFSFYKKGITNKVPTKDITLERALELIRGEQYREDVERLRKATDESLIKTIKKGLDYFTFSGIFTKRLTDNLVQHSGLICLDLDDLNEELFRVKEWLKADPYTLAVFTSPSGRGLKVLVKIDGSKHLATFKALEKYYKTNFEVELDKSGKDVTRACFVSYDPDLHYNEKAELFEVAEEPEEQRPSAGTRVQVITGTYIQDMDPLFKDAARLFVLHQQGSTSLLQRKLKLGYNRAGKIIDQLERARIVGPFDGAKARTVLIPDEYALEKHLEGIIEGAPIEQPANLSASEQFARNKNLRRVELVVEQAEQNNIDLTGEYTDWQLIAFSLATFGEEGRSYWHRVSRLYSEYDEKEADDKFDNALEKGRFKTPAKFFSIAKDYGLAVSLPKTIAEHRDEADVKDIIGDEAGADDYLKFGIWEMDGTYWSLDQKSKKVNISNFKMRILYHVETSDEEAYRLIEIKNIHGHSAVVKMNTDDFVSVGSFKKVVARKGNFIFKGSEPDLCRLQDKLQREERPTKLVKQLGWNRRGKFYAFANGIYDVADNMFLMVDEYGIVEHRVLDKDNVAHPQNYFIPALSKIFAEKEDLFANDKKFVLKKSDITFSLWARQYCQVYGKQGELALAFYLMAIYSDIVFRDMGRRFPLLFVYGKRGTGKGTLIGSLLRLFGDGQDQLMLGGASTVVGFMRKFAQFCNAIVWLDEYKNNLKANYIESLKNVYDRIGYERGKKDNTFQTESTPILSACILSGQEMPTIEPALFTRNILVSLTETKRTESAKEQYRKLQDMEDAGLSGITVDLLKHREYIDIHFKEAFIKEQKTLAKAVNNNEVDDRLIINYAALIAIVELFDQQGVALPFNRNQFKELCQKNLMEQFFILKGSDDASKFWDIVESLFNDNRIKENHHFQLKNGYLYLRVQDIYQEYAEALQKRKDPNMLDKATLEKYLESDAKTFVARERKMFGGAQKWCFVFRYKELGVDLIRGDSVEHLKARYREMDIEYTEEVDRESLVPVAVEDDLPF